MSQSGMGAFEAAVELYTLAGGALLLQGRNAPDYLRDDPARRSLAGILHAAPVQRLARGYADSVHDPWDRPYRLFPGALPTGWLVVPFRIHGQRQNGDVPLPTDPFTIVVADASGHRVVGYPDSRDRALYIWSAGSNGKDDQLQSAMPGDAATG